MTERGALETGDGDISLDPGIEEVEEHEKRAAFAKEHLDEFELGKATSKGTSIAARPQLNPLSFTAPDDAFGSEKTPLSRGCYEAVDYIRWIQTVDIQEAEKKAAEEKRAAKETTETKREDAVRSKGALRLLMCPVERSFSSQGGQRPKKIFEVSTGVDKSERRQFLPPLTRLTVTQTADTWLDATGPPSGFEINEQSAPTSLESVDATSELFQHPKLRGTLVNRPSIAKFMPDGTGFLRSEARRSLRPIKRYSVPSEQGGDWQREARVRPLPLKRQTIAATSPHPAVPLISEMGRTKSAPLEAMIENDEEEEEDPGPVPTVQTANTFPGSLVQATNASAEVVNNEEEEKSTPDRGVLRAFTPMDLGQVVDDDDHTHHHHRGAKFRAFVDKLRIDEDLHHAPDTSWEKRELWVEGDGTLWYESVRQRAEVCLFDSVPLDILEVVLPEAGELERVFRVGLPPPDEDEMDEWASFEWKPIYFRAPDMETLELFLEIWECGSAGGSSWIDCQRGSVEADSSDELFREESFHRMSMNLGAVHYSRRLAKGGEEAWFEPSIGSRSADSAFSRPKHGEVLEGLNDPSTRGKLVPNSSLGQLQ